MAQHYKNVCIFLAFLSTMAPRTLLAKTPSLVDGELLVNIDAASNSGSTQLNLRNDTNEPASILLHVEKFVLQTTGKTVPANVAFERADSQEGGPFLKAELAPGDLLFARLKITGFNEAGEAHVNLFNRDELLTTIKVVKFNVPFGVGLNTVDPDHPKLTFQRKRPGLLVFKNEDPMTYPVDWSLLLSDTATVLGTSTALLPGRSTVPSDFNVPGHAFTGWFSGLLKDREQEGRLVLRFSPPGEVGCPAPPTKTIPVRVRMQYWPSWVQSIASAIFVTAALIAGGVCSLFLSLWVPQKLRRIELIQRIDRLARKTQRLSTKIDSSLRVEVRVERLRLAELIRGVGPFNADAHTLLEGYKRDLDLLDRRVSLVQELDEVTGTLESLRAKSADAPARVLDNVRRQLDAATEALKLPMPGEADLQRAQDVIRGVGERLREAIYEDPQLAGQLAAWVTELKDAYDKNGPIGQLQKCRELRQKVKELFDLFDNKDYEKKSKILPKHYHWLSSVIERLYVLRHYIRAWENATGDRRKRIEGFEDVLIQCLRLRTYNAIDRARQIRRELEEDILPTTIEEELSKKAFSIHTVPIQPHPNQPVRLEVRFNRKDLNTCTARQEFTCVWDFGAIGKEEGWAIWHYFRNEDETGFSVSFRGPDGETIKGDGGSREAAVSHCMQLHGDVKKLHSGRRWIEATRFFVAFGVAILGLTAGAKKELMKLDVFAALVVVFLIGFGADAVKNLITRRPQEEG